jgi:UDP-2,3-diacylglucosamine pyrophosphatase LpxH
MAENNRESEIMEMNKDIFDCITVQNYGHDRLCKQFGVGDRKAREWIAIAKYLQNNNMPFIVDPMGQPKAEVIKREIKGDKWKVAVISDTHIGSNVFRPEELKTFVQYALDSGVETFLLPGDIIDGTKVYRGQEYEQSISGVDDQIAYFAEIFPKVPKAYFIVGNHEYAAFKSVGKNVGQDMSAARKEFQYVGCMEGRVTINDVIFELFHPQGSGSYALSYKLQKRIESYMPGDKPRFLLMGHFHQSMCMTVRNVTGYHCGSFQGPNTFSKALSLANVTGGWILEIMSENGEVNSVKSEFIQSY